MSQLFRKGMNWLLPIVLFGVGTKSDLSVHTVDKKVAQAKLRDNSMKGRQIRVSLRT